MTIKQEILNQLNDSLYRLPIKPDDTAVYVVDRPLAAVKLEELIKDIVRLAYEAGYSQAVEEERGCGVYGDEVDRFILELFNTQI